MFLWSFSVSLDNICLGDFYGYLLGIMSMIKSKKGSTSGSIGEFGLTLRIRYPCPFWVPMLETYDWLPPILQTLIRVYNLNGFIKDNIIIYKIIATSPGSPYKIA